MKNKNVSLFHFPSHIFLDVLLTYMIAGAFVTFQCPDYNGVIYGLSFILLAIKYVLRSMTANYFWKVHRYLAEVLHPVAMRAREDGMVLRPTINDAAVSRFLFLLNVPLLLICAANLISNVYFPDVRIGEGRVASVVFWVTSLAYIPVFYYVRHVTVKRLVRESWVAKATPVR